MHRNNSPQLALYQYVMISFFLLKLTTNSKKPCVWSVKNTAVCISVHLNRSLECKFIACCWNWLLWIFVVHRIWHKSLPGVTASHQLIPVFPCTCLTLRSRIWVHHTFHQQLQAWLRLNAGTVCMWHWSETSLQFSQEVFIKQLIKVNTTVVYLRFFWTVFRLPQPWLCPR